MATMSDAQADDLIAGMDKLRDAFHACGVQLDFETFCPSIENQLQLGLASLRHLRKKQHASEAAGGASASFSA